MERKSRFFTHHPRTYPQERSLFGAPFAQNDSVNFGWGLFAEHDSLNGGCAAGCGIAGD